MVVLSLLQDYLTYRTQKVVLPGGSSDLSFVKAGVPQGSVLGPLLFLVYINVIVHEIESGINLFADGTSLSIVVNTPDIYGAILQSDIDKVSRWADRWLVKFNPSKSKSLLISRKQIKPVHLDLSLSDVVIPSVPSHKHLGIIIWDNIHEYQKEELDKILNEAARIVTGCTKLVSIVDLIRESGW